MAAEPLRPHRTYSFQCPTVPSSTAWAVVVTGRMSARHRLVSFVTNAHELVERLVDELASRRRPNCPAIGSHERVGVRDRLRHETVVRRAITSLLRERKTVDAHHERPAMRIRRA